MTYLTEGNITKQIIRLSIPLLIGNIIQQFYNTINMMIVGRYVGEDAFSSVGVSGSVMNLFIAIIIGLSVGFSILYANSYGAQDYEKLRKTIFLTATIGIFTTVILSLTGLIFLKPILNAIRTPVNLFSDCIIYLRIIFAGMIFCLFYNLMASILQALGKTNILLYIIVISMLSNIAFNYFFVAVLDMGVMGAALATVISQIISSSLCFLYIKRYLPLIIIKKSDMSWNKNLLITSWKYGTTSALQQSSLFIGKLLVQRSINALGTASIMAYTADICIEQLVLAFGDSGAAAIAIFVAQNYGHNEKERVICGLKHGMKLMVTTGALLSIFLFIIKSWVLSFLISKDNLQSTLIALSYLNIMCMFYPISFTANSFQGYFRGIGMIQLAFAATLSQIVIRVILTYNMTSFFQLKAVAFATGIGWSAMIIIQIISFYKSRRLIKEEV